MLLYEYRVDAFQSNPALFWILIALTSLSVFMNSYVIYSIIRNTNLHIPNNFLAAGLALDEIFLALTICLLQTLNLDWESISRASKLQDSHLGGCNSDFNFPESWTVCYSGFILNLESILNIIIVSCSISVALHIFSITILKFFAVLYPLKYIG